MRRSLNMNPRLLRQFCTFVSNLNSFLVSYLWLCACLIEEFCVSSRWKIYLQYDGEQNKIRTLMSCSVFDQACLALESKTVTCKDESSMRTSRRRFGCIDRR